jgi:tetratricopeptide (TPR) repeat protein
VQDNLAKMKRARMFHNLALTCFVVTLVLHLLEIDLGFPRYKVWAVGIGTTAFFTLVFIASTPISTESKICFWTVFARTHVADFIEMAALRSMLLGSFRMVAWIFLAGGVLTAFTPKYQDALTLCNAYLDAHFIPKETLRNQKLILGTRHAFEANPGSIAACRELAYLLLRTRRFQAAYAILNSGLVLHPAEEEEEETHSPSRIDLVTLKAIACGDLPGREQEEIVLWREVLAKRPDDAEARHNLGLALLRLHNFSEAEVELKQAVTLAVDDLKHFKKLYQINKTTVATLSEALKRRLDGLKFRAGASAYQLAICSSLLEKTRDAPRHLKLSRQLGYEISTFDRDLQRFRPQTASAPPPKK